MENNNIIKNIIKWIITLSLLSSNVNAELLNNFSNKQFYKELKKWYNINFFQDWDLKSKNTKIDIENSKYLNLDITKTVLDNNDSLEYFLDKYHYFKRKTKNKSDMIYIFKSKELNNKFIYLLYKNKELKIASLTSPWRWKNQTPIRKFKTQWKYFKKRSKKFNKYPMPFAIHLDGWYFIHWWKIATWNPASHGCFRLKWVASWLNFKNIKYNEQIPVIFTWYDNSF